MRASKDSSQSNNSYTTNKTLSFLIITYFQVTHSHLYKILATGLRFFTFYGPIGRPDMDYFGFANMYFAGERLRSSIMVILIMTFIETLLLSSRLLRGLSNY